MALSEKERELILVSFGQVSQQSNLFIDTFYRILWNIAPETKSLFEHTKMVHQGKKLMMIFAHVFGGLDNADELETVMRDVGARHIHYGVQKELFSTMEVALLETLDALPGEAFTEEVEQAWSEVFRMMTEAAISVYPESSPEEV